jgi:hypothetical protein
VSASVQVGEIATPARALDNECPKPSSAKPADGAKSAFVAAEPISGGRRRRFLGSQSLGSSLEKTLILAVRDE